MNVPSEKTTELLGDYAYQSVQKHFKKSIKHEKQVLADKDPEPLHQMRVGMRRLRTALQVFAPALALPKAVSTDRIKKFAQRLGAVRDLDILQVRLEERYRPDLPGKEQKHLEKVLEHLQQQRRQHFARIEQVLQGDRYQQFKQHFEDWLETPQYEAIAALPILSTLPDLLLPLISQLLLHPGWLVGTRSQYSTLEVSENPDPKTIKHWLEQQSEQLHDLRKQTKQVRYQTEFFTEFYEADYQAQVDEFQTIQEVLGEIQDYSVLKDFLGKQLKANWQKDIPSLAERLEHEQTNLWATWQPLQQRYLDAAYRDRLRRLVLTPGSTDVQPPIQPVPAASVPAASVPTSNGVGSLPGKREQQQKQH